MSLSRWEVFRDNATKGYRFFRCSCGSLLREDYPLEKHTSCPRLFAGGRGQQVIAQKISFIEWTLLKAGVTHWLTERAKERQSRSA